MKKLNYDSLLFVPNEFAVTKMIPEEYYAISNGEDYCDFQVYLYWADNLFSANIWHTNENQLVTYEKDETSKFTDSESIFTKIKLDEKISNYSLIEIDILRRETYTSEFSKEDKENNTIFSFDYTSDSFLEWYNQYHYEVIDKFFRADNFKTEPWYGHISLFRFIENPKKRVNKKLDYLIKYLLVRKKNLFPTTIIKKAGGLSICLRNSFLLQIFGMA